MFCLKCGELIEDKNAFCPKCGEKTCKNNTTTGKEKATVIVPTVVYTENPKNVILQKSSEYIGKKLIGIVTAVLVFVVIILVILFMGKANLKKQLLRDWFTVESDNGSYYTLELDFSDDVIEYNFESAYSWLNTQISTVEYKIVSGNKIKILDYNQIVEIKFNDDKTMMTCTPAITSTDLTEFWFNND